MVIFPKTAHLCAKIRAQNVRTVKLGSALIYNGSSPEANLAQMNIRFLTGAIELGYSKVALGESVGNPELQCHISSAVVGEAPGNTARKGRNNGAPLSLRIPAIRLGYLVEKRCPPVKKGQFCRLVGRDGFRVTLGQK
jgi:hypothetical protein